MTFNVKCHSLCFFFLFWFQLVQHVICRKYKPIWLKLGLCEMFSLEYTFKNSQSFRKEKEGLQAEFICIWISYTISWNKMLIFKLFVITAKTLSLFEEENGRVGMASQAIWFQSPSIWCCLQIMWSAVSMNRRKMNMKVFFKWWHTTQKLENKMMIVVGSTKFELTVMLRVLKWLTIKRI